MVTTPAQIATATNARQGVRPANCLFIMDPPKFICLCVKRLWSDRQRGKNPAAATTESNPAEALAIAESAKSDLVAVFEKFAAFAGRENHRFLAACGQFK